MCSSLNCQAVTRSYRLNGETFYYARQGFTGIYGLIFLLAENPCLKDEVVRLIQKMDFSWALTKTQI